MSSIKVLGYSVFSNYFSRKSSVLSIYVADPELYFFCFLITSSLIFLASATLFISIITFISLRILRIPMNLYVVPEI